MSNNDIVFGSQHSLLDYSMGDWGSSHLSVSGISYGVRCSSTPGASVSFTYQHVGIGIWGFHLPNRDLPQLNVEVDGTFIQPLLPASTSDNQSVWHQWEVAYVTPLDLKNHTTTLQVVEASHANPFCLMKFEALVPDRLSQLASESNSTAETTSSPTSSASAIPSGNHTPVGTLVGAVIAAVFVTLLLCGALFLWWRRSRQHRYRRTSLDDDGACSDYTDGHHLSMKSWQAESGRSTPSIRKSTRSFSFKPFSLPRVFPRRKQTAVEARPPVSFIGDLIPRSTSPVASIDSRWLDSNMADEKKWTPLPEVTPPANETVFMVQAKVTEVQQPDDRTGHSAPVVLPPPVHQSPSDTTSPTRALTA
ncbi:hypothetical protein C8Q74DRAFT_506434 [Fomes fomentarius]|nr:hypothetical protein C8Q74DRAFT_506434 [Fomes fomentarius]